MAAPTAPVTAQSAVPGPSVGGAGARAPAGPTVSVVVPSYRRPDDLARCLTGLAAQDLPPCEVVVVHRVDDAGTRSVAGRFRGFVRCVGVAEPGQLAALRAGAAAAVGEVIAFTDDDAVPRPDWCRRLGEAFVPPGVGAVGGRDVVHHGSEIEDGSERRVGLVTGLGRVVGRHHLGTGPARDVQHLKGVNMAVRRGCLAFADGLRGQGAQVANDLAISLAVLGSGRRVVYDPAIVVDHHPAPRFDEDGRRSRSLRARSDAAFNQSYVVFSLQPRLRWRRLAYVVLWGDRDNGGVVRSLAARLRGETVLRGTFSPLLRAHFDAWGEARSRPLRLVPVQR